MPACASNDSYVTKNELNDYKTEQNNRFDLVESVAINNTKTIVDNKILIENNNIIIDQNFGDIDFIYNELSVLTSGYNKLDADMIDYIMHDGDVIQVRE